MGLKELRILACLWLVVPCLAIESGATTASQSLSTLKEGNTRFVENKRTFTNISADRRAELVAGQHPYVTILSCSDSRVPLEHIFDAGIGDLFVIRVAGNVAGTDEIATIEYGVEHLQTPLLVVMGHTKCGAITAVVKGDRLGGSLPYLLADAKNMVRDIKAKNKGASQDKLLGACIKENVWRVIEKILKKSSTVRELIRKNELTVVGALYNIESGAVDWLGQHPNQSMIVK